MTVQTVLDPINDLIEQAKRVLPGGSFGNMPAEVILKEGKGGRIWDEAGREYVDFLLGSGPMFVGHGHPEVTAAIQAQVPLGTTFFGNNRPGNFPRPTPDSAGIPKSVQDEMLVAAFNDVAMAESLIEEHKDELAGVIVEPFQRLIPPKPGFLQALRTVTAKHGIPLIFDEVVTGFRF